MLFRINPPVTKRLLQKYHPDIFAGKQNPKDSFFRLRHPCPKTEAVLKTASKTWSQSLVLL